MRSQDGDEVVQATYVKLTDTEAGRVGGYLVIWGDAARRDLEGEYFTPQTELGLSWYPCRPVLYHHGQDRFVKSAVIGVMDTLRRDDIGLWVEAQLDLRQKYAAAVQRLVEKGVLAWSSGSLPHLVEVADDGRIQQWPIVEGSLTPTPAEPRRTDARTIKSAYEALGLDVMRLGLGAEQDKGKREGSIPITMKGQIMQVQEENITSSVKKLPIADPNEATKSNIEVSSPFDPYDAMDMLHGYMMMRAHKSFRGTSERYANALAHKLGKAGWMASKAAGDLSGTIVTGYGDDWVPDMWSGQIWQQARQENVILPLFRSIEMPSNPFELPVEGTDPTVHFVPETTLEAQLTLEGASIPGSKIGSDKVQLRAGKLALRVGFSAELVEDTVVPVLNIYREQAVRAISHSIDYVLLNGDTETGNVGNVNTDSVAPGATDRFLVFDGLRKLPLVTNSSNAVSMGGAPTLAKLRETRFKMASRYSARPADLVWIVDGGTYARLLNLEQFLTVDKAGALATAQTGQIGFLDGTAVLLSAEMPLTKSAGTITVGGVNDKGTALCVFRPGWIVGYRRRIAVNVDYLPYYDSYQMTATIRLAFVRLDNGVASMLHNITV